MTMMMIMGCLVVRFRRSWVGERGRRREQMVQGWRALSVVR